MLKKLKKKFLKNRKSLILILMTFFTFLYVYVNGHIDNWLIYYNQPLAMLSYIAIVFSAIFVAYQAYLFRKDYEARKEHSEFDTAYQLAGYYAHKILPNTVFANKILSRINLEIDKDFYKKSNLFKNFTAEEAQNIFGKDVIENFRIAVFSFNVEDIYFYEYTKTKSPRSKIETEIDKPLPKNISKSKSKTKFGVNLAQNQFYYDKCCEMRDAILATLNDIEYFAMYFCSELAAPDTVYMSIHQTYLEFIMNNYLFICFQNDKPGHEYYTHAVQLYKDWTETSNRKDKERSDALAKINSPEKPKKTHS